MKTQAQPQYLKLTQDIVFKVFFSRNKQVLISLLKAFLPIRDEITDVRILNPVQKKQKVFLKDPAIHPDILNRKHAILDLKVKLASGEHVNVEMQTVPRKGFLKRVLFYWARLHGQSLKQGQDYRQVKPTYSLIFTGRSIFDKEVKGYINKIALRLVEYPYINLDMSLSLVIAELNKFNKSYDKLVDLREKWCYLLRHSDELTEQECSYLSQEEEMKMALENLSEISKDEQLYWEAFDREMGERDRMSDIQISRREGLEEGIAQGVKQGRVKERHQVALNMSKEGFDVATISKMTGLSEAEIKQIKSAD